MLIGIAGFAVAMAIFVWLQHRNMAVVLTRVVRRLAPEDWRGTLSDGASAIDDEVVATYRRRPALLRAGLLRLATWVTGAGEIWLVTYFLGRSLSAIDALILESLGNGIYAAAFIVPGAIGVLEGGFVVFGALFGLPAGYFAVDFVIEARARIALGPSGSACLAVDGDAELFTPKRRCH